MHSVILLTKPSLNVTFIVLAVGQLVLGHHIDALRVSHWQYNFWSLSQWRNAINIRLCRFLDFLSSLSLLQVQGLLTPVTSRFPFFCQICLLVFDVKLFEIFEFVFQWPSHFFSRSISNVTSLNQIDFVPGCPFRCSKITF